MDLSERIEQLRFYKWILAHDVLGPQEDLLWRKQQDAEGWHPKQPA